MSIFSTGSTALYSAQLAIATAGHNIANVNTAGYRRQELVFETQTPVLTGSGFIGQGASVDTVRRVYNDFLERQVSQNEAGTGYLTRYLDGMKQVDSVLGDRKIGFSTTLQSFFSAMNDLADNPTSVPARQSVLGAAESLSSNISSIGNYLQSLQEGVNVEVEAMVGRVNSYAQNIFELNNKIAAIQTSSSQTPNDLLDQRDQMVSELNALVGVQVLKDQNTGAFNIFIGQGYQLVGPAGANPLAAAQSPDNPLKLEVMTGSGGVQLSGKTRAFNGELGGLLDFRSQMLDEAQNSLGRIAIVLAQEFNDQHKLGIDLNGNAGVDFFNVPDASIISRTTNTGSADFSVAFTNPQALTLSDYRLTYDGANYTMTRLSDGQTTSPFAMGGTVDGMTISLSSGAPAAGDSFLIRPTVNGATEIDVNILNPAQIAAAAPVVGSAGTANTGGAQLRQPTVNSLNANLTSTVTITFNSPTPGPQTFNVVGAGTGNPVNVPFTSGGDISYNGWTFKIVGVPANGDTFTVAANTDGVLDNRNALALSALQSNRTLVGGTTTLEGAYSSMVGRIGNKTNEVTVNQKAQANLLEQTRQIQQSASGVNLDEEAANLIKFQQIYQAAAKVLQTANTMFDSLLNI